MNRQEAERAVKAGVKRWGCELRDLKIEDNVITIHVKGTQDLIQVGQEHNWKNETPNQLALRVSRFCTAYANNIPYRFSWASL